eukprot:5564093-Amphidinium_carterae.1
MHKTSSHACESAGVAMQVQTLEGGTLLIDPLNDSLTRPTMGHHIIDVAEHVHALAVNKRLTTGSAGQAAIVPTSHFCSKP